MLGYDVDYVPGWDCHGLPIEWKIEEEITAPRARSRRTRSPKAEFRRECRALRRALDRRAARGVQAPGRRGRLGASLLDHGLRRRGGDRAEIQKFAANGTLYRGSKPVMWTPVERTALADAEVEYEDSRRDTVWVKFPVTVGTTARGPMAYDCSEALRS